ncbi:MAG TPA: STAS domain-containing protein [Candidatus Hydrogenedentes bacterium]|nr:STAS domain-containing protein [Candidatus Hydrogenedentota bacterium]
MLAIERLDLGEVTVLRLRGDIEEATINTLLLALVNCLEQQRNRVILNLAGVAFINNKCCGMLVDRLGRFQEAGGDMYLASPNLYIRRLFRMLSLNHVFQCYDTEEQAVRGISNPAAA